jgi:hypothetical protein
MEKIEKTLSWIDKRIGDYLSLLTKVVLLHTKDDEKSRETESLLRTTLRTAFFLDFYSETGDKDFLLEANRYRSLMYSGIPEGDKPDLESIERRIVKLFDYEKQIWARVKSGQRVPNEDIEKFWRMKSADALFYGRIIRIFTGKKDFTLPIYIYTQILDIGLDLREYEKDFQENSPNILYMKLSQRIPIAEIPPIKRDAIQKAIGLSLHLDLEKVVEKLSRQVSDFDFGDCSFLREAIKQRYSEFYKEFTSRKSAP